MRTFVVASLLVLAASAAVLAGSLDEKVGDSEVRLYAAPYAIAIGRTVAEQDLVARLTRQGYERVREGSVATGEFFWGHETFRIGRRAFRHGGRSWRATELVLTLRREDGMVTSITPSDDETARLEPETIAESLRADRAPRIPEPFAELPERLWRAVLAAEDHRFFEHGGVDGRAIARAMLANAKAGRVVQGGSTITQQLVKNRELDGERSLGRKVSEALRALAIESEYSKEEILEAYLNHIYWGHVGGVAVHGVGAASRAWFSRSPRDLDLAECAALAAMIQGPNRLAPDEHAARLEERRNWVLSRMEELGWASSAEIERARRTPVRARIEPPRHALARHYASWIKEEVREADTARAEGGGVVVETTLDAWLQQAVEERVADHLDDLRRRYRRLASAPLSAAAIAMDARTGDILAYVGGDPEATRDAFDRARLSSRPIGSTAKPFLLLETFERCGDGEPLTAATRVQDGRFEWALDKKRTWSPVNYDGDDRGEVSVRLALRDSLNVPFARIARHCGIDGIAERLQSAGLDVPRPAPPAIALGAIDASPLVLVRAYSVFATLGDRVEPRPFTRIETPDGTRVARERSERRRVAYDSTAFIVRDLLRDAVEQGTGQAAAIEGVSVAGKTGSTSDLRDAWFAGVADGIVLVVWIGRDDAKPIGLTGGAAAAPLWRSIAERAARMRPPLPIDVPGTVVRRSIDPETGLRTRVFATGEVEEYFRRTAQPPRDRWLRRDEPVVIR